MTPEQRDKRQRIMRRSMALGHCVCDPRQPCPCEPFTARDVCACAGERLPSTAGPVRLTEHVRHVGCASKIGKKDLDAVVRSLPEFADARVLVGASAGDDAGVIELSPGVASILTVDVFTPSVDDPYTFGQVAAANSVSDIYAMGGTPQTALSIIGFPIHSLPPEVMREILRGGIDKMAEAGVAVIGGHSINDEEVKCGFAVLGTAPADGFVRNAGARPGDWLVLTKPLGGGIAGFAHQLGRAAPETLAEVTAAMTTLNRLAGEHLRPCGVHAATDVTGFSLLGHMAEIARNSGVAIDLQVDDIPLFTGVAELARQEVLPGAVERNREAVAPALLDLSALAPAQEAILFGPETSGGLLVFLPAAQARAYLAALERGGVTDATVIGRVVGEHPGGLIRAVTARRAEFAPLKPTAVPVPAAAVAPPPPAAQAGDEEPCCCQHAPAGPAAPAPTASQATVPTAEGDAFRPLPLADAFRTYMAAVTAPGVLGAKEKKLMALALSVATRCGPCIRINTEAARKAGAAEAEIAEAAQLGVAFGGAPAGLFYSTLR